MIEKINNILAGIPATLIGGVFLILSFIKVNFPFDPAWLTVIICGLPLLYLTIFRLIHNPGISKITSCLLITIAMIAAIIIGDLFAAGEVAFIMELGAILEDMTTERAKKGLKQILTIAPTQGRRIVDGKEEMIAADEIRHDDILRVLPGETVPVDGIILKGESSLDQSVMTGESIPVDKTTGDQVFCGTINCFGAIDIKATNVGQDSSLQKLIRMVEEAEEKKAPMARIADKWATWLVPLVCVIAIITWIVTKDVVRAVTLLVVFCPCALVLATPTAIMAAIGQATKYGVIIKSGEALEKMGKVNTIAFDKTGTLTYGKLEVSDVIAFDKDGNKVSGEANLQLTKIAASAESKSEHPFGKAIVKYANDNDVSLMESDKFKMTAGKGIYAVIDNKKVLCGSESFLAEGKIIIKQNVHDTLLQLRLQGKASILVAVENVCIGIIAMSDVLRPEAKEMVEKLHGMDTEVVLLTGDNDTTAQYFAKQVGITQVRSQLLPAEKVKNISNIQDKGKPVCMIGDGVNDAPALKTASVGVAMGSMGSDIAVEAAEIALMSDDISKIPYLKRLSNATVSTIKFSIGLSMSINFVAVILSIMGILNPTTGALVHNAGSCFVVLIAALLYDRKFE